MEFSYGTPSLMSTSTSGFSAGSLSFGGLESMETSPVDLISPVKQIDPNIIYQRYKNIVNTLLKSSKTYEYIEIFEELMNLEQDIVTENIANKGSCSDITNLSSTSLNKIANLLTEEPENPELFSWLFCAFDKAYTEKLVRREAAIGISGSYYDESTGKPINRSSLISYGWDPNLEAIRRSMTNIQRLSGAGSFGYVWQVEIENLSKLAYLKTYQEPDKDFIKHEFFIGYIMNQLRAVIPNFMYVYGMFNCEAIDKNKPVVCPEATEYYEGKLIENKVNYLLMEVISPGTSFQDLIPTINLFRFMSIYLQVISALAMAYYAFDYTHYDLHYGNVLIQTTKNNELVYIPYNFEGKKFYIATRTMAKIIDYGKSHVRLTRDGQEMHFGYIFEHSGSSVSAFKSNPLHDIYKFTCFSLEYAGLKNRKILDTLFYIAKRFQSFKDIESSADFMAVGKALLNTPGGKYYEYPNIPNDPLRTETIYTDHIGYILKTYPNLLGSVIFDTIPEGGKMLFCSPDTCSKFSDIEDIANM